MHAEPAPTKQVVGYARVSVDNENKVSPEMQAEAIANYCQLKGWELVDTVIERGRSAGEGKKRPLFDRVRKMIRKGEADGLIVWKLDRCSRSVKDFADLMSELKERDAEFISITEGFDTSTPTGRFTLNIMMALAEMERDRMSERASALHAWRFKRGVDPLGIPALGYRRERDEGGNYVGPLLVDEEKATLIKQAFDLFIETGGGTGALQKFFGDAGHPKYASSVRLILENPVYIGVRVVDGVEIPGNWPAIIDVATRSRVLALINARKTKRGRPKSPRFLLSSIAVCGNCGLPMMVHSGTVEGRRRYQCAWVKLPPGGRRPEGCFMSIFCDLTEAYVTAEVLAAITPQRWKAMRRRRETVAAPTVDTMSLEAKLTQLAEDWANEKITHGEFHAARTVLIDRIAEVDQAFDDDVDEDELPDVEDLHRAWHTPGKMTTEQKRLVITAVVDHIVVKPAFLIPGRKNGWAPVEDRVEIKWR